MDVGQIKRLVDVQFGTFEHVLKSNIAGLEVAQQLCQLNQLREDNSRLEGTVDRLAKDVRTWLVVKNHLLKMTLDGLTSSAFVNNNTISGKSRRRQPVADVKFVNDDNARQILDAFAKDIGSQLQDVKPTPPSDQDEEEEEEKVTPMVGAPEVVVKTSSVTFKTKKGSKTKKRLKAEVKRELTLTGPSVLTRGRRGTKGAGSLINPIKYHDCVLCKAGFYREKVLREHYRKNHDLDYATDPEMPLPTDALQIECQIQTDRQTDSKCNICGLQLASLEEALVHKTNYHVQTRYRRHQCTECGMRFVLAKELQDHMMVHSCRFK